MTPENAINDYLDNLDELDTSDCNGFPLLFDEWNATNARMGRPCGTWLHYLTYCRNYVPVRGYATLVQFGAIDDDDYIPDGDTQ